MVRTWWHGKETRGIEINRGHSNDIQRRLVCPVPSQSYSCCIISGEVDSNEYCTLFTEIVI